MLKIAQDVIASKEIALVVDFAIEVNREVESLSVELETVKGALREEGKLRSAASKRNSVEIAGNLGNVTITGVRPGPKARQGADLASLEKVLPPDVFRALFIKRVETTVTISSAFEEMLPLLNHGQRMMLANFVEISPSTPRVSLPK